MDATTTAVFASAGVNPSVLTGFLSTIWNQALLFLIYAVETIWPFLLVAGLIALFISVAYRMLRMHR